MDDLVRKALLFGIGVTALTKEKAEKFVKEIQKRENIDTEEGKKMVKQLVIVSEKKAKELAEIVNKHVTGTLAEAAKNSKITSLEKKLKTKAKSSGRKVAKVGKKLAKKGARKFAGKAAKVGVKYISKKAAKKVIRKIRR
jgi:polyhydroxyalkanoate synthesis regulator phasin